MWTWQLDCEGSAIAPPKTLAAATAPHSCSICGHQGSGMTLAVGRMNDCATRIDCWRGGGDEFAFIMPGLFEGVVLDDWSGASPASRLFWAPLIFAAGFVLALIVLGVGRLFKWAPIDNGARLFLFGLFFGLVGAGPLLSYWVSSAEIWALLLVAVLGLSLRYTLRHKA